MNPEYVAAAFAEETLKLGGVPEINFIAKKAGDLKLTTGRIVACDPLGFFEYDPFQREVPPRIYPVILYMARGGVDYRVAYAKLEFAVGRVRSWERALRVGEQDSAEGYGVDLATGCFMDNAASRVMLDRWGENGEFSDELSDNMSGEWAEYVLDQTTGLNIIYFTSGYGDGGYKSYWGLSADGDVLCLVTDFEVPEGAAAWNARTRGFDRTRLSTFLGGGTESAKPKRWWEFWKWVSSLFVEICSAEVTRCLFA